MASKKICNKKLIYEVSTEFKVPDKLVKELTDFYTNQISLEIRKGDMNGVRVPYLGVFQVKHNMQQYKDFFMALTPAFRKMFRRMSKQDNESNMGILKIEEPNDEIIYDNGEL
jgi:hypothetical protein